MKLSTETLLAFKEATEVVPGNVYPAKGGKGGTEYWVVLSLTANGANLIGFDKEGLPCSTATYLRGALRERPLIGKVQLHEVVLKSEL